jgi:two-component system sensor histidine kinase ChvG
VHLVVLLVPVAGLEFARVYERELLEGLEADMRHQAVLTRRFVEALSVTAPNGWHEHAAQLESVLSLAARQTRLRVRLLDVEGEVRVDSHRHGPPEGPEAPPPRHLPSLTRVEASLGGRSPGPAWSPLAERTEVVAALNGTPSAYTRIREQEPSVFLFLSEPLRQNGAVTGVVYVTGSTKPVMTKLYRIRERLELVLLVALAITGAVTLLLAWSITRPLERLARSATRIAAGEYNLALPAPGSGEIRELGEALRTMTDTLRRRLRDTENFAADVAHGFKSPLTALRGSAELLAAGALDDPEARPRFLGAIELEVNRLDRLVSQLLELSRLEASEVAPAPVDVLELLQELSDRFETPDARVRVLATTARALALARRHDLDVALANLVDNALAVTPPGGEVRLKVSESFDGKHAVVRIEVEDDGPGIPVEHRERLFERFFTTDKDQGTGLGLPIARAVVEAVGGRVFLDVAEAAPSVTVPTRFVVELPRAQRP